MVDTDYLIKQVHQERCELRERTLAKLYKNKPLNEAEKNCCINAILVQDENEKKLDK